MNRFKQIALVLLLIAISCQKDDDKKNAPVLTTTEVTEISDNSARSGGKIVDDGNSIILSCGICLSTEAEPDTSDFYTVDELKDGAFVSFLSNLLSETTYYARAYAINSVGISYGEQVSFVTTAMLTLPTVELISIDNVKYTAASCKNIVISEGGSPVTARGVCWSKNYNPTIADAHTVDGSGAGNYSSVISGLEEWTTYHARAYATNSNGTAYGITKSFRTDTDNIYVSGGFTILGNYEIIKHEMQKLNDSIYTSNVVLFRDKDGIKFVRATDDNAPFWGTNDGGWENGSLIYSPENEINSQMVPPPPETGNYTITIDIRNLRYSIEHNSEPFPELFLYGTAVSAGNDIYKALPLNGTNGEYQITTTLVGEEFIGLIGVLGQISPQYGESGVYTNPTEVGVSYSLLPESENFTPKPIRVPTESGNYTIYVNLNEMTYRFEKSF